MRCQQPLYIQCTVVGRMFRGGPDDTWGGAMFCLEKPKIVLYNLVKTIVRSVKVNSLFLCLQGKRKKFSD